MTFTNIMSFDIQRHITNTACSLFSNQNIGTKAYLTTNIRTIFPLRKDLIKHVNKLLNNGEHHLSIILFNHLTNGYAIYRIADHSPYRKI